MVGHESLPNSLLYFNSVLQYREENYLVIEGDGVNGVGFTQAGESLLNNIIVPLHRSLRLCKFSITIHTFLTFSKASNENINADVVDYGIGIEDSSLEPMVDETLDGINFYKFGLKDQTVMDMDMDLKDSLLISESESEQIESNHHRVLERDEQSNENEDVFDEIWLSSLPPSLQLSLLWAIDGMELVEGRGPLDAQITRIMLQDSKQLEKLAELGQENDESETGIQPDAILNYLKTRINDLTRCLVC
jgi:hypothetical protein